ncbi:MAG: lytic transglycosylase domain-containing protein [Deltaproteobacteria bacterium]|nr:lytic transglycosylase domain-containing protein [Deltaproteobacteria bacterium]
MRISVGLMYLVSGFFVLSLHAATLDAPTMVVQEYNEHFIGHGGRGSANTDNQSLAKAVAGVRAYLNEHMSYAAASKVDRLARLIVKLARQHEIPSGLILSVIKVESGFQSWAISPRGALGLMQLMPETGEWLASRYGIKWSGQAILLDEETNILLGIKYLSYLKEKYNGDLRMMLSAYNRGPAKVDEEVSAGKGVGTLGYYRKILGQRQSKKTYVD